MTDIQQPQPKMKYKSFSYNTNLKWAGNRAGMIHSEGKSGFRVASPPEFKGEEGVWTPEDLFVAAVEICTMTTFLAFAFRQNLPLVEYESTAEGKLEFVDGGYRFIKVYVKPRIVVESEEAKEEAARLIHDAHKKCLIANSIKADVEIEPDIASA